MPRIVPPSLVTKNPASLALAQFSHAAVAVSGVIVRRTKEQSRTLSFRLQSEMCCPIAINNSLAPGRQGMGEPPNPESGSGDASS
jgi:hypothetical protein